MESELWKHVPDYEGLYKISYFGSVKILRTNKIKKPYSRDGRYLSINFIKNDEEKAFLIHRVVAKVFIPNPLNLPMVNHLDLNKLNNFYKNLEWCTAQRNISHAFDKGIIKNPVSKGNNSWNNKPVIQFSLNMKFIKEWDSAWSAIQENLNLSDSGISNCCAKRIKYHQGFVWRLKSDTEIQHLLL